MTRLHAEVMHALNELEQALSVPDQISPGEAVSDHTIAAWQARDRINEAFEEAMETSHENSHDHHTVCAGRS